MPAAKEGDRPDYLQGALVSIDPSNGYIKAMVGGRDFMESRFNRATQAKRQSGSAFKPFVYATALEAGYTPATVITGLDNPILTAQGDWVPEDEHSSGDSMTLRSALRTSSNRAAVQLLTSVGIPNAVSYAQKMNVGTPPSVPSLALGASDVTLISLTGAYASFANGGFVRDPVMIRRVDDRDGKVLYQDQGKSHRAISESTAYLMASMLSDVINAGTANRARQAGFTLPAAGKTGTTNDYVDAWFVGFTPRVVTGVWVGFDQPKTIIANGYGGELAVPIWTAFMKRATRSDKPDWLEKPDNIVSANVCRMSGKLPNGGCDSVQVVIEGWVAREALDDLHRVLRQGHTADDRVSTPRVHVAARQAGRCLRQGRPDAGARRRSGVAIAASREHGRQRQSLTRASGSVCLTVVGRDCAGRGTEEEEGVLVASLRRRRQE